MTSLSLNNATKQFCLIALFSNGKPDTRPSDKGGIYSVLLAPKFGLLLQTKGPDALCVRFVVSLINAHSPPTASKGSPTPLPDPGRLQSAPTPSRTEHLPTRTQPLRRLWRPRG